MGSEVYANGRAISGKSNDGKVTATMPDVCLSPPSPPAGPIPIPYPLSSFASDTTDGSTSVTIAGDPVMLKDKSYFKKCTGDEAATKSLGQGVVTHTLTGKVYFVAWSMDVEIEAENVVRHLDMTTSNHASPMANASVPWVQVAEAAFGPGGKCEGINVDLKLRRHSDKCDPVGGVTQQRHHLIPDRCAKGLGTYSYDTAPCICVSGKNQHDPGGTHRDCHMAIDYLEMDALKAGRKVTYGEAAPVAAQSAGEAVERDLSDKEVECVKFQLDEYYKKEGSGRAGFSDSTELNTTGDDGGKVLAKMLTAPAP